MNQVPKKLLLLLLCLPLVAGCASLPGSLRALIPGGVNAADAEWVGVKSGEPVSLLATVASIAADPQTAALLGAALEISGQTDPLGTLLPITPIGETAPRWVVCTEAWVAKCRAIPVHAKVHVAGQVNRVGHMKPSRVVADDFDD